MKIDGKPIASELFSNLQKKVYKLKEKNIIPRIAIILVGNNPASVSYVKRKEVKAKEIGAEATIFHLPEDTSEETLLDLIQKLNKDVSVHGIIVQRPLPKIYNLSSINQAVIPAKDIDAFNTQTPFDMPLAIAAILLLKHTYSNETHQQSFSDWLKAKNIVVIGKGETGGGPIRTLLGKLGIQPEIVDSKTTNPTLITKKADIIISAVGKPRVITKDMLKAKVILISVGQHKEADGKFHGDYEEEDIQDVASCYSPTPGGVGPVNVACLLQNLVAAAENSIAQNT